MPGNDDQVVSESSSTPPGDQRRELLALYDAAMPEVYGYLVTRCRSVTLAEDLTSETFLAAADAVERGTVASLTVAWLIGVARHKLVDHWRRLAREERLLVAVDAQPDPDPDPWEVQLDVMTAHRVLGDLGAHHRSVLTLRYLDGLPVREVAEHLERTEHATEALLVRARRAFRDAYAGGRHRDHDQREEER